MWIFSSSYEIGLRVRTSFILCVSYDDFLESLE